MTGNEVEEEEIKPGWVYVGVGVGWVWGEGGAPRGVVDAAV